MIPLGGFHQLGLRYLEQSAVVAYIATLLLLILTFANASTPTSAAERRRRRRHRRRSTQAKDDEDFSTALLRALRAGAYCAVLLAVVPPLMGALLLLIGEDGETGFDLSDTSTLRAAIATVSTICFCAMQRHSVHSAKVENWVWIDEFCYHVIILDNLLFWDQQPEMVPTMAALAVLAVLQTVFPAGLVRFGTAERS